MPSGRSGQTSDAVLRGFGSELRQRIWLEHATQFAYLPSSKRLVERPIRHHLVPEMLHQASKQGGLQPTLEIPIGLVAVFPREGVETRENRRHNLLYQSLACARIGWQFNEP